MLHQKNKQNKSHLYPDEHPLVLPVRTENVKQFRELLKSLIQIFPKIECIREQEKEPGIHFHISCSMDQAWFFGYGMCLIENVPEVNTPAKFKAKMLLR